MSTQSFKNLAQAAARNVELSDRSYVHRNFGVARDAHLSVVLYSGQHLPVFVDHMIRVIRAARNSERKMAFLCVILHSSGLPDPESRQRYVEFMDTCKEDTVGCAYAITGEGFPADAHRMVLDQMNTQDRHGLPTFAAATIPEATQWLKDNGVDDDEIDRLVALVDSIKQEQATLDDAR